MDQDAVDLKNFADGKSEAAFRELVRRRIDFVYGTALRQVGGDAHLAEEVAQNVFLDLARKAPSLTDRANLAGWLYTSTRFAAAKAVRARMRRQKHETEAHDMNEILTGSGGASPENMDWQELRPVLDAAMHDLGERDREAILLRYFEGRSLADVGAAIGLAENSARMRVERALEKLRARLARRGISSTAAALGATLVAQPVVAAPAGLAATVAGAALQGAAVAGTAGVLAGVGRFFSGQNLAAVGVVSLAGLTLYLGADERLKTQLAAAAQHQEQALVDARAANAALRADNLRLIAAQTAHAEARAAAMKIDPLARLRAVVVLIKEGAIGRVQWRTDGIAGQVITAPVVALFALQPVEVNALNDALDRARREISALAIAAAAVERKTREIVVTVPDVPAAREPLERLRVFFQETLGAERFALAQEIGWMPAVERHLAMLGLEPFTLRIMHVTSPRLPEYPYAIDQQRAVPAGRPLPAQSRPGPDTHPGAMDFAALKLNLGPFATFVPADF